MPAFDADCLSESDAGGLERALAGRRPLLDEFEPHRSVAEVSALNGERFLRLDGLLHREIDEARVLNDVLEYLAARLPGSWGCSEHETWILVARPVTRPDGEFSPWCITGGPGYSLTGQEG